MQTNLMTLFWLGPLTVWVEVSECQRCGKEGTEACYDGRRVTTSPRTLLPVWSTAPVLDQCFRQGQWPGWSNALAVSGWAAWCSKSVQRGRKAGSCLWEVVVDLPSCAAVALLPTRGCPLATCTWNSLAKSHSWKGQAGTPYMSGMTFNSTSISGLLPPCFPTG